VVARTDTALRAYFRGKWARKAPQQAIAATAQKLARTIYHRLKYCEEYVEESAEEYERKRQERELRNGPQTHCSSGSHD
jgi:transposase